MKKLFLILLFLPVLLTAQTISLTEYPHGNDKEFYFVGTSLDSGTYTSTAINLNQFDSDLGKSTTVATDDTGYVVTSVTPGKGLSYYLVLDTLTTGSEITGVYIQGKMTNGTWANVDTVLARDTMNIYHAGLTTRGILDLNADLWMFTQYRVSVVSTHSLGNIFNAKLTLYAYRRD